jgi:hyperosmotically inducible protein
MIIRMLGALTIGVAAAYFLDPASGKRRRARARDKVTHYRKEAREYAKGTVRDLRNRARGIVHGVERRLGRGERQINP